MKQLILIFSCLFLLHCKQQVSLNEKRIKKAEPLEKEFKEKGRNYFSLIFNNNDTLDIVSNFHPKEKIDSITFQNKTINGKYFYCGKSGLNKQIFNSLINRYSKFKKIRNVNTSHNIIIKNDTLYLSGFNNVKCLKKNDNVLIKSTIFTFYQKNKKTHLMIIDDFIKIE